MAELKLTKDEKQFLKETCPYLELPYLDFLGGYHYDPSEVKIVQTENRLSDKPILHYFKLILMIQIKYEPKIRQFKLLMFDEFE